MDRTSVEWRGYLPAITTPFLEDGDVDWDGLERLVEWLVGEGMHGIAVAGTTGEWHSMTSPERHQLFAVAARTAAGRIPVLAGCSALTTAEAIEHARAAQTAGCDGILLTPPPYVRPNDQELVAFYRAVADAGELPLCVYNWPRGTGIDLSVDVQRRLAEIPNIVAIKNSSGSMDQFLAGFLALREEIRYYGVQLNELGLMLVQQFDADGTIGSAGILGSRQPDFFNHAWRGNDSAALRCGASEGLLAARWTTGGYGPRFGSGPAIMKAALNLRGLPGGFPRPPLLPLDAQETAIVRETLVELELLEVGA